MIRSYPFVCLGGSTSPPGPPGWYRGKESTRQCRRHERHEFDPWVKKIPWRRAWRPTAVFLPGESNGQRSLVWLQSMGSQRVGHDWVHARTHTHTHTHTPPPSSLILSSLLTLSSSLNVYYVQELDPAVVRLLVMNGTWSLPYNIHCLMQKETGGWIITMLCDRISEECSGLTGKGCSGHIPDRLSKCKLKLDLGGKGKLARPRRWGKSFQAEGTPWVTVWRHNILFQTCSSGERVEEGKARRMERLEGAGIWGSWWVGWDLA